MGVPMAGASESTLQLLFPRPNPFPWNLFHPPGSDLGPGLSWDLESGVALCLNTQNLLTWCRPRVPSGPCHHLN